MSSIYKQLVAHLLTHPNDIDTTLQQLRPEEIDDIEARAIYNGIVAAAENGGVQQFTDHGAPMVDLMHLSTYVHEASRGLYPIDASAKLLSKVCEEDWVALPTTIDTFIQRVQVQTIQMRAREHINALADDIGDQLAFDRLVELRHEVVAHTDNDDPDMNPLVSNSVVDEMGWDMLDNYEAPNAIIPGLIYPSTVSLLAGDPMVGKSGLMLHIASCIALGQAPWDGCPTPDRGYVLYMSYDEIITQLSRRLRQLNMTAGGRSYTKQEYRAGVGPPGGGVILWGMHPDQPPSTVARYKLPHGTAHLDHDLAVFRKNGTPISGIVIDTMSRAMTGLKEESAVDMTILVDALTHVAVANGCWIVLLHHLRKSSADSDGDVFERIRGSGAIMGCVRAAGVFKRGGDAHTRMLVTRTNLDRDPPNALFEVAPREEPGSIVYFKTLTSEESSPIEYFMDTEKLQQTVLINRMLDLDDDTKMSETSGEVRQVKRKTIAKWANLGWVAETDGSKPNRKEWMITDRGRESGKLGGKPEAAQVEPELSKVDVTDMFEQDDEEEIPD